MPDHAAAPDKPISAVFIIEITPITAPMLAGWVEKGHRVAAIVVPGPRPGKQSSFGTWRRRWRRRLVLRQHLVPAEVPVIEFGRPHDWAALCQRLAGFNADVLITFGFPTLIPETVLKLFAKGGLNLHPALLPNYKGPHPIARLVLDGQDETHGGLSLHKMTSGFDEGDILAQIAFSPGDWQSTATLSRALASGMKMLVAEAASDHSAGVLEGMPQPEGTFTWAQVGRTPVVVGSQWSSAHVAKIWRVVGRAVALYVPIDGKLARLAHPIRRLGPATGEPPARRWGMIEFDCADGRVAHLAYSGFARQLTRWQRAFGRVRLGQRFFEIRRFGERTEGSR
ncbi:MULTISPECIES: formyltransferase family protein [Mesorhizobium]|uniref:formyltransferase family protein n=1 Tax=Mesorhizobium TaxID=68287 RepID=UPI001092ABFE|nr:MULTISPECIES: formyltransferase family protein [Mesorhizobium]MDX8431848.1 formyltransferase family protein [Mesorhizobium abyssinicae]TGQ45489.1 hypothetical protein EN857_02060 [Mesorhizobium sp. M4B.F.Ca.ET.214.01.1.1]TGQ63118.1 hypothetical protein EN854_02060 [Mesorhizobium sp. M4B.F.Ca.ET.211.01.1.1]TGU40756.1 hypothetical protein EN793_02060 [Mesorhizobium sp. M4B.F.Ca.ET.150.01.1.1]